ncbi:hypothetical protein ACMS02_001434 [Cronobacter turicensis]
MKLIDLLVQELPKRGGWPGSASYAAQDWDGGAYFYSVKPYLTAKGRVWDSNEAYEECFMLDGASDYATAIVTREQYEAALAAAQQPVWDGEGLPPVGCECEAIYNSDEDEWFKVKIIAHDSGRVVGRWLEGNNGDYILYHSFPGSFRPIRSEADRKRDEIAKDINAAVDASGTLGHMIYDAIAAGKIPHIRIE